MSPRPFSVRLKAAEERGAILVITTVVMLSLLVFAAYAIDASIWFVHHRHLQTEADAAALAAAQNFQFGCSATDEAAIANVVHQYDGSAPTPLAPTYNPQVSVTPTTASTTTTPVAGHVLYSGLNQPNYLPTQSGPGDSLTTHPCTDNVIDVKMTEQGLPSFLPFASAGDINAQAQVGFQVAASTTGGVPFVEPIPTPTSVAVEFVNENTGAVLPTPGAVSLSTPPLTDSNHGITWTSTLPIDYADPGNGGSTNDTFPVGMRVAVNPSGGAASFPCTAPETCYDASNTPNLGVVFTRVWSNSGAPGSPIANPVAPQAGNVWLQPCTVSGGGCSTACAPGLANSNFFSSSSAATEQLCANMTFGGGLTCSQASLTLKAGGTSVAMTCPNGANGTADATWSSAPISVPALVPATQQGNNVIPAMNNGVMNLTLSWSTASGCLPVGASGGGTDSSGSCTQGTTHKVCGDGKGNDPNPCTGSFDGATAASPETVQQAYTGAYSLSSGLPTAAGGLSPGPNSNSGTISSASVTDVSGNEIQTIPNGTNMTGDKVTVNFYGFQSEATIGTSVKDPPFEFTLGGNQGNGDISCTGNNGKSAFENAIETGCAGTYASNSIQPPNVVCTNASTNATPGPATCVNTNPGGGKAFGIGNALTVKIDGSTGASCTSPNHWTLPNAIGDVLASGDPRLIEVFLTDNVQLPNGSTLEPIRGFAQFYITGWGDTKQNGGDPCLTVPNGGNYVQGPGVGTTPCPGTLACTADDLPPDNSDGVVVGHFVTFINSFGISTGQTCVAGQLNICVPVLTK
jgi:Flp pilus assembly protein TadG